MDMLMLVYLLVWCLGLVFLVKVGKIIWWKPLQMKQHFEAQGVRGPPYRLLYGNMLDMLQMREKAMARPMELSHDIIPRALSFYDYWARNYGIGQTFIHWFGSNVRLTITDPELIWEVLCNKSGLYKKSTQMKQLNGDGLLSLEGEMWAQHRRIINPAFHIENLKGLVPTIVTSTSNMLARWKERIEKDAKEIEVYKEFRDLTEDILAHIVFGSSHVEGKYIFDMQAQQAHLSTEVPRSLLYALISRFLPSRKNMYMKKLDKEIRSSLRQLIESRKKAWSLGVANSYGGDLLSVMTAGGTTTKNGSLPQLQQHKSMMMNTEEIIDECKTFFLAGHDTTLCLLTWTMVLLGMYPQWQEKARKEVLTMCGHGAPKPENVTHLKLMNMILNESLRLYPPVVALIRQAEHDTKLGRLSIPGGTQLLFPIIALHHDEGLWGERAKEFYPERFVEGVSKAARHPMAFMPFGLGPRFCVGQNFAMLQTKIILAMILQRFTFSVSDNYSHSPIPMVFLQPQFGAQIVMTNNE